MLLLGGEILCQFIIYITKLKYIDMSILPRQAKFSSEDKGWNLVLFHDEMYKKWGILEDFMAELVAI